MSSRKRSNSNSGDDAPEHKRTRRGERGGNALQKAKEVTAPRAVDEHGGTQNLPPAYNPSNRSDVFNITPLDTDADERTGNPEKHPTSSANGTRPAAQGPAAEDFGISAMLSNSYNDPQKLKEALCYVYGISQGKDDLMKQQVDLIRTQRAQIDYWKKECAEESTRYEESNARVGYYYEAAQQDRDCAVSCAETLSDQVKRNKELSTTIIEKDSESAKLAEEQEAAMATIGNLEQQIRDFEAEVVAFDSQTAEKETTVEALKNASKDARLVDESRKDAKKAISKEIKARAAAAEAKTAAAEEKSNHEVTLRKWSDTISRLTREAEALRAAAAAGSAAVIAQLTNEITDLRTKVVEAVREKNDAVTEKNTAKGNLNQNIVNMNGRVAELQNQLAEAQKQLSVQQHSPGDDGS